MIPWGMDTDALNTFIQAYAAGSLAAAARRLKITPMAASRRLSALETELGVRLMNRSTRSVSLTAEGEALLPYATSIVEAAEAGRAVLLRQLAIELDHIGHGLADQHGIFGQRGHRLRLSENSD